MNEVSLHKEYKVLATDLDNTLLTSDIKIADFDKKMLIELQKCGVSIVMVSGLIIFSLLIFLFHN